jgi:hypothetical protein
VPLQAIALEAIERQLSTRHGRLLFPAERGGYLGLHNFRNREWKPAQVAAGIEPLAQNLRSVTRSRPSHSALALPPPSTSPAIWAQA